MSSNTFRPRNMLLIIVMLVLAVAAYGFAATNTVADSYAGDGAGTVNGFVVENIHYTLNTTTPTVIDTVEFDLDDGSGTYVVSNATAYVELNSDAGTWYACITGVSATHDLLCDLTASSVPVGATFTSLRVVAAE